MALRVRRAHGRGRLETFPGVERRAAPCRQHAEAIRKPVRIGLRDIERRLHAQRAEQLALRKLLKAYGEARFQQASDQPRGKVGVEKLPVRRVCGERARVD